MKVSRAMQKRPFTRISWRSETALRTDRRTGTSTGIEHHQCVRLRKSVYGLIDAPRAWWEGVETDMNKLKWRTLTAEPCFWVMTSVTGRI